MIFAQELFDDCIDEILPHIQSNHDETGTTFSDLEVAIDRYYLLDEVGAVRVYTLRKDGNLIGYNIFIIDTPMHHANEVWATCDVVYIDPAYRGTGHTLGFFLQCEDDLRDNGAEVIVYHEPVRKPFTRLLEELGMEHTENVYTKRIGN